MTKANDKFRLAQYSITFRGRVVTASESVDGKLSDAENSEDGRWTVFLKTREEKKRKFVS